MAVDLISIRPAKARHAEALAGAHADAWRLAYQGIIPHLHLQHMIARRPTKWWARSIARHASILVLEYDGQAVGYTTFGRARMHNTPYHGEIFEIYVSPVYQGLGFGGRLFRATHGTLEERRLRGLIVWALADNEIACEFYRGLGGKPVTERAEAFSGVTLKKLAFVWGRTRRKFFCDRT